MKKILFKKLSLDYLSFLALTLISTGTVIWVFQAVNFLDIMIEDGRDYWVYIKFSLLNFPKIISKLFLFISFFSLFYIIIKYEEKNELIIFWNFGVNKLRVIHYVINLSMLLMVFQLLLNIYIVPYSQDKARSYLRSSKINFYDNFIKPKKFNDTIKGLTIYTEKKYKNGNLGNLYIKKEINKNEFQITYAKEGEFKQVGNIPVLVLYNGATISSTNNSITNISFAKSNFSLANIETNTTTYKKTQEINSTKLLNCIISYYKDKKTQFEIKIKNIENCSYENIHNIFKEAYKRFITPFYIPVLSLISLFLIILSKENLNYQKLRIFTFSAGFLAIIFAETTIRLISKNFYQNLIFFSIPIILSFCLYFYLLIKFKYKFKVN